MWIVRLAEGIVAIGAAVFILLNLVAMIQSVRRSRKWKDRGISVLILTVLILFFMTDDTSAACTKGVNCLCDTISPTPLICRDWEEPTLYGDSTIGAGAPYYGPWYDGSVRTGACSGTGTYARGCNSFWAQMFGQGNTTTAANWQNGLPSPATLGSSCNNFSGPCYVGPYQVGDPFQSNSFAKMGIFRVAEFTDEISTLTVPTNTVSGTAGPFDGIQSLAYRNPAAVNSGILGFQAFTATRHLGITYALGYSSNLNNTGLLNQPWKHNEFRQPHNPNSSNDGLAGFWGSGVSTGSAPPDYFPFYGFVTFDPSVNVTTATTNCNTGIAAATITKGSVVCDGSAYMKFTGASGVGVYQQSVNFPYATWGCIRNEWDLSTPSAAHVIWKFQGTGMSNEITVLDISNLDMTMTGAGCAAGDCTGWDQVVFDNYANENQSGATVLTGFRYEDNMVITNGTPATCSQIGFTSNGGGGGGSTTSQGTVVMFIEWGTLVATGLWHFRQAILAGAMAVCVGTGTLAAVTTQKTKQITYQATLKTIQGVNTLLAKVQR